MASAPAPRPSVVAWFCRVVARAAASVFPLEFWLELI